MRQPEAEQRVDTVANQLNDAEQKVGQAADVARKRAAQLSIATALAMLIGAFIASTVEPVIARVVLTEKPVESFAENRTIKPDPVELSLARRRGCDRRTRPSWRNLLLVGSLHGELFKEANMGFGRGVLLWILGVPIPIIILLALFWHH